MPRHVTGVLISLT